MLHETLKKIFEEIWKESFGNFQEIFLDEIPKESLE